jgi:hypothetical protein
MTLEPRIGPNGRDDDLTRALRELYAPPTEDSYWDALERRILARVRASGEDAWWGQLAHWARAGAVAASVALLLAGVTFWRTKHERERLAYEALVESTRLAAVQVATQHGTEPEREATLRYVISP